MTALEQQHKAVHVCVCHCSALRGILACKLWSCIPSQRMQRLLHFPLVLLLLLLLHHLYGKW